MQQILVAEITKIERGLPNKTSPNPSRLRSECVSFDRDKLIDHIEKKYKLKLVKDDADDFPYFTDGGFKFLAQDEYWNYEIVCLPYDII